MSHKRLRIVVPVLVLVCAFPALVGTVHAAERARVEPRSKLSPAPFTGAGGVWILGGCEESSSGCPN
jgi:hypothetical protein